MPETQDSIVRIETMLKPLDRPVWSENKAQLIQKYVRYFIMVTRHGAYIDAFSGPQLEAFNDHSWSAKLVLEIEPPWLTRFILCELSNEQAEHLNRLVTERKRAGDQRVIDLHRGDCNITLPRALREKPIKPNQATFCLLDQRTFECDWQTVREVALHKSSGNKIEIFYFVPAGWLHRSMSALGSQETLVRWWGREDVGPLLAARHVQDFAPIFTDRFRNELGYRSVMAWAIYDRGNDGKIMYFMIHATDHEEAPKLMRRAYQNATGALEPAEQLQLELEAAGFDKDAMNR